MAKADPAAAPLLAGGRRIGELARRLYDDGHGTLIPPDGGAVGKTARILRRRRRHPVFEAAVEHDGVEVRIDVLLPDGDAWRIVEVKSAGRVRDEHAFDCAVQAWVFERAGHTLSGIALAHVDTTFVYGGDDDRRGYHGLLIEHDMGEAVATLLPTIREEVCRANDAIAGDEPAIAVGRHCFAPRTCPFVEHCWPVSSEYPLFDLPYADKDTLAGFVAAGCEDVRDVPPSALNARQRRVRRVAQSGRAEHLPGAAAELAGLDYPRCYLDFETVAPAIPIFAGTRPYEALPFQWSCHYEAPSGRLRHAGVLDLTGDAPMRRVAESLIRALGKSGRVFTYSSYERRIIGELAARYPELGPSLDAIRSRLVDLKPLAERHFYHPGMHGSWSLKALLPFIGANFDYGELEEIQSGTDASEAYLEAIAPATTAARREELRERLERYCRYDTQALVALAAFLAAEPDC